MENLWISLILSTSLAALAVWRRALTRSAVILAWFFSLVITYCGGWISFLALASTFLFTILAGRISGKNREKIEKNLHAKSGRRDLVQIICNVFIGTVMTAVYALTKDMIFLVSFGGAMAASLADSLASELGVMSRRPPVDICSRKPVTKGLSGGVTAFGFAMSALGAAIIALVCLPLGIGLAGCVIITLSGFFGALLDSVLGSLFQAKYRCAVCGALTEKKHHCDQEGRLEKGIRGLNNDGVNFLNNVSAAALALLLSWALESIL